MSLIHWWPLNGNLNDYGLNDKTLTSASSSDNANGKIGKCRSFSGGGYCTISETTSSAIESLALWIKPNSFPNDSSWQCLIVNASQSGYANSLFGIYFEYSQYLAVCCRGNTNVLTYKHNWTAGQWHHVAATYDGSMVKLYVDGSKVAEKSVTSGSISSSNRITIGANGSLSGAFINGYINDARVYDHALSQKEVKEISKGLVLHYNFEDEYAEGTTNLGNTSSNYSNMNKGVAYNCSAWGGDAGTVTFYANGGYNNYPYKVYHKTATGSGGIYYKTANDITIEAGKTYTVSVYVKASREFSDSHYSFNINRGSDNNYITSGQSITFTTEWKRISWTFTATSAQAGSYGEMSIVYNDGQADYYVYYCGFQIEAKDHATPYVNGTRSNGLIYDNSGYGNNGTINGNVEIVSDSACGEHSANIVNSYIKVPTINYPELTILFWFKRNALTSTRQFIFTGWPGVSIELTASNRWQVYYTKNSSSATISIPISVTLQANVWYHIAIVIGSSGNKSFVNGVQTGTSTYETPYYNSTDFRIGSYGSYVNFNAKLADFKIYATALSASDILAEYQRKAAIDRNGNLYSGQFIEQNGTTKIATKKGQVITDNFVEGTDKVKVFDKYIELEYIESTGTQYINSDITTLTAPFVVEVAYDKTNTETSDQSLFGARGIGKYPNIYQNYYETAFGTTSSNTATGNDGKHILVSDSSSGFYKDGTKLLNVTLSSKSGTQPALICAFTEESSLSPKWFFKGKLYYIKVISDKQMIRDFTPAKRKSDNVIGLFDLVNQKFYTNAGTGTFTAGPEKGELSIICTNELNEL